ncbi:hypothetical protein [Lacticaseibacillus hulanensis]|jgi:hypothetical protein|uniref:hypothetical protein n=1 Tax=Lacticaseibacillus hulanensis TaxID=2493111 RepID=UPI000FD72785|nr:hypothetical protein [Lacticaseibacillus hulanensis]
MDIEVINGKSHKVSLKISDLADIEKLKQSMGKDGKMHYIVTINKRSYGVSDVEGDRIKRLLGK